MKVLFHIGLMLAASTASVYAQAPAPQQLTVWWTKGSYKAEDDALAAAVRKFEAKTGVKVELLQVPADEIVAKTAAALKDGTAPDVAYADAFDFQTTGQWAYEGRLEDLSDIIGPTKDRFLRNTVETTYLYNDKTKKKAYYAFPVKQQTMQIQYWKDLLQEAGRKESDIPTNWQAYWDFWCKVPGSIAKKNTKKHPYGIGQPMGLNSSDSYYAFLTFVDAYNVKLVDDNGKLLVDDPKVKQGLANALRDYTTMYKNDCVPTSSRVWRDDDNDAAFRNKVVVMTPNTTMSVVATAFDDANNATLTQEQRAGAKKDYDDIVTTGYPKKPDGSKMVYRASVKTGVVFESGKNKKNAKEFVRFVMQDENLQPYIEGGYGRWFPVMKSEMASKFWQADPHRKAVFSQFGAGTVTFEFTKNYKFTLLNQENVWAKAMGRVVNYEWTPEKAVDEMIDRIKAVAG